jgi:hypothetical protein
VFLVTLIATFALAVGLGACDSKKDSKTAQEEGSSEKGKKEKTTKKDSKTAQEEGSSEKGKNKVDCKEVCERSFKTCLSELLITSGKVSAEKLEMVKKRPGMLDRMKKQGFDVCMKNCQKKGGLGADATAINKCLEKKNCQEFAKCVGPLLK